jgi:Family of unknown function (DUF5906)
MVADRRALNDHLPLIHSPDFEAERQRLITTVGEKYAWVAQQSGMVLRRNPLKQTYKDYEFERVCKAHYSFLYKDDRGATRIWYPTVNNLLGAIRDDGEELPLKIIEGLDFMPGMEEITQDDDGFIVLNLWQPPPWQVISDAEEPTLFLEHLAYVFDGDQATIGHVLDWIAHLVQRPAERIDHALLITSAAKGIGKSTLGQIVKRLIGEKNARTAAPKDLKSQFDGWLAGKLFIQVDEVYESGNWELANKLKSIITEPVVSVNLKYGPQMEINNYARLIMFSNHTAPLSLEDGDRRYFVFNSQAQPRSDDYYDRLHREIMSAAGMNAIYSFLMRRDLSQFNPHRRPPMTQAKQDIVDVSGNPLSVYIEQITASAHLFTALGREFSWDALERLLQKEGYSAHSKNQKEVGQALKAAGVESIRPTHGGLRVRLYRLPEWACRKERRKEQESAYEEEADF